MADKNSNHQNSSLNRAKRIFLLNLALFFCLGFVVIGIIKYTEDENTPKNHPPAPPQKELSLPELAYLKGEMQALRERPETMPKYEEEWVRKVSEQTIRRDSDFQGLDEGRIQELSQQYFEAYTDQFDQYFDVSAARELGYNLGIKFDPAIHSVNSIDRQITVNRSWCEETYNLDREAEWRLFFEAYEKGFNRGYLIVIEGITSQSTKPESVFP